MAGVEIRLGPDTHTHPTANERAALAADRSRIADIQAQILELERALKSLKDERDVLQNRLDAYTYPVLTLPNEIVSEIFVHFLPLYPKCPPPIGVLSPNLLGQICRKWREIALTTPALWRAIFLRLRNLTRLPQKLRLLEISLERSGSCPLSISLDIGIGDQLPEIDPFIRSIAGHSARWEHLKLYSPFHRFPSVEGPLPLLRSLTMGFFNDAMSENLVSAFHAAPLLQKVSISFYSPLYDAFLLWSQLTVFDGGPFLPQQCLDVLAKAPNLVYCSLEMTWADYTGYTGPVVTLSSLETFILSGALPQDTSWKFIDALTLPALRRFQVPEPVLQEDPLTTLSSLIARSGCSVQELCITETTISRAYYRLLLSVGSFIFRGSLDVADPFSLRPQEEEDTEPEVGGESSSSDDRSDEEGSSDESSE
ncbi:hypothetical protein B0H19DRAFT_1366871 [Mycena capillaripes]|nr:hypothetical protein B0H19DRAFT_1366871 [Mycena capillaripes]